MSVESSKHTQNSSMVTILQQRMIVGKWQSTPSSTYKILVRHHSISSNCIIKSTITYGKKIWIGTFWFQMIITWKCKKNVKVQTLFYKEKLILILLLNNNNTRQIKVKHYNINVLWNMFCYYIITYFENKWNVLNTKSYCYVSSLSSSDDSSSIKSSLTTKYAMCDALLEY